MNKALLIFFIMFLVTGVADAVDIEVNNATTTWKISTPAISSNLDNNLSTVTARIIVDHANILYMIYLYGITPSLDNNLSIVKDRIIIDHANVVHNPYLFSSPTELNKNASLVTPRIIIDHANIVHNPILQLSGIAFVDIKNYKFNKNYIRVPLDTTVTWINFDGTTHNITEDSGKFSSGNLKRNQSFEYKFKLPGVYYYHCKIHPSMKGTIIVITSDKIPPTSITGLKNISYAPNYINWTWKDPKNIDFENVLIYINGKYKTSVMKGIRYYKLTNLISGRLYKISTHTVDTGGNINKTWVNYTTRTRDIIPPASITNLKNITYKPTYIKWTWKDPNTLDFSKVMIYLNGKFKINVIRGKQFYNATSLQRNTWYKISTRAVDYNGNINKTWVNNSAKTAK